MKKPLSKNVSRADNQQERLIKIGWVVGFVDGEGCFSIGFTKQPDRQESLRIRRGYTTGYQVTPRFAVVQGKSSLKSLELLQKFFGVGGISINRRYDNHKEHLYRYSVNSKKDLLNVIIPFFKQNQLQTEKRKNFEMFTRCLEIINKKEHLATKGLIKIAQITERMNHKKPRTKLIRILRCHTSDLK